MFVCREDTVSKPCPIGTITSNGKIHTFEVSPTLGKRFEIRLPVAKISINLEKNKASNTLSWTTQSLPKPLLGYHTPNTYRGTDIQPIFSVKSTGAIPFPQGTTITLHDAPIGGNTLNTTVIHTPSSETTL